MIFKKITIENYKSFQLPTSIDFPIGSQGKSIFLVGGMNGAGKTSVMEAINYCLYGAKQEIIYKYINRKELVKGNAYVSFELILETEDSEEIIIKRSWSAGTVDKPKYKDLEEKLVIIKDGKRVTVQSKDLWQDYIDATIPKSITQFFFFDGEKIQEIADDDHSEVRLKSSLEAALGIQYISKLANDVLQIKSKERQSFVDISDEDIEFKESQLKLEKSKLKKKMLDKDEIKKELDSFRKEYDDVKKRFEAIFNREAGTLDETKQKERKRVQLSNKLGQVDAQINNLIEKYLPWAIAGSIFPNIKQQIEEERDISKHKIISENASLLANSILEVVDNPEPIYATPLNEGQKSILRERIENLLKKEDDAKKSIQNLSERDVAKVLNKIDEIENSEVLILKSLLIEKEELEIEIKSLEYIGAGITSDSERQLFEELQQKMESYQTQIGRQSVNLQHVDEDILLLTNQIGEYETELNKLYGKHNISREKKDFLVECDAIAGLLNEYIIKLRKNKIHILQEKTFEMYKQLSSRSGLIKDIQIDDNTYEITIIDRNGHVMKKSSLSAGEKEIFAVSLLWGLAQTSKLNLPIIIDTPLSRLDSIHRDNIVNQYFPNAAEQVIILSTDTEVDNNYFKSLEPHLAGAGKLIFDQLNELTSYEKGYFWN